MAENNSSAPLKTAEGAYPALPAPDTHCHDEDTGRDVWSYSAEQMRAYAAQAVAAQAAPAAVADWEEAARTMSVEIARNCNSVPQLVFPFLYLGLKKLFATPALPATEDSSAGDLAEVQAEPVAWLIQRSAFHVSPHGQDAEGYEWLEVADEPGMEGSFPVYAAPQAQPADALPQRTESEIVKQTEELAKYLLRWKWGLEPESPEAELRNSGNLKAQVCWNAACEIQELITDTDVENAVSELDAAMAAAQEGGKAAKEA